MPKLGIKPGAAAWNPLALSSELLKDWWRNGINLWPKMQQNLLLYCMHIQRDLFGGLASILGCPRAFSRLPTLEDWPFRPLRGLKGQISRLAASLRPGQPKIWARQPKRSCCLCIQCNKRPLPPQPFLNLSTYCLNWYWLDFFYEKIARGAPLILW